MVTASLPLCFNLRVEDALRIPVASINGTVASGIVSLPCVYPVIILILVVARLIGFVQPVAFQANGLDERFNQTIQPMLMIFCSK